MDITIKYADLKVETSYDAPGRVPGMGCPICEGGHDLHIVNINDDMEAHGCDWNKSYILTFLCEISHCMFDIGFYNHKGGMYVRWKESDRKCDCESCEMERHEHILRFETHPENRNGVIS
jgi:hypothetical protein